MQLGKRGQRNGPNGYSYLWLLLFVAISAAGLARVGQGWSAAMQREREKELRFREQAYAQAIASFVAAGGGEAAQRHPLRLEDLLVDHRGAIVKNHLRQVYVDPYTGSADWELIPAPNGSGFVEVRSRSKRGKWEPS